MIEKLKSFLKSDKFWKLVRYGVIGICTTAVNYVTLWLLHYKLGVIASYDVANAVAIVASVIFAYVTNKLIVFRSHVHGAAALVREAAAFFASRAFTMILEWGSLFIIHNLIGVDSDRWGMVTKLIVNVVVLILNFVFSQVFVFKGDKKEGKRE